MPRVRKIPREEAEREELKRAVGASPAPLASTGHLKLIDAAYPHLSDWILSRGWVELGSDMHSGSLIRILDPGGLIWESSTTYTTLDDLLRAAEHALAEMEESSEL